MINLIAIRVEDLKYLVNLFYDTVESKDDDVIKRLWRALEANK